MVQTNCLDKIVIIGGATASGKTELAIELAKQIDGEIVSADSINIYKGLDIGSAKPSIDERREILHHMINVVTPLDEFTVSEYKELATKCIKDVISRNKTPIIVGGTGFYIEAILFDLSYGNSKKNEELREKFSKILEIHGVDYLFSLLEDVDKETAQKLHKNDVVRVIRALEIFYSTGVKKSQINDKVNPNYDYNVFCVNFPREELYKRIDVRVDKMLEKGLIDEVQGLIDLGVTKNSQCMQGIGYKETYDFLVNGGKLEELTELIKLNTRHYAKRQITFFKRFDNLVNLEPISATENAKKIMEITGIK